MGIEVGICRDAWMHKWTDAHMIHKWICGCVWMCVDGWVDGWAEKCVEDVWMDGWVGRCVDRQTDV